MILIISLYYAEQYETLQCDGDLLTTNQSKWLNGSLDEIK